jgi:hypothetical protein
MKPSDWISVDERLPPVLVEVLIFWDERVRVAMLDNRGDHMDWLISNAFYIDLEDASHWMPIVPPEVKDD